MPDSIPREEILRRVATRLRNERIRRGFSMTELAARAGLSQQMVSYIERQKRNPTLDSLLRITGALEIQLSDVINSAERRERP